MIGEFENSELGSINFGFELSGDYQKINEVRLVLSGSKGNFLVEGQVNKDEVSFDLTQLKPYIPSGEYSVKMEVILDDNRYISPITETLRVKQTPKVEAKTKEVVSNHPSKLEFKVDASPKMKYPKEIWIETQEKLGNTVIESADKKKLISMKGKIKVSEFDLTK